MKKEFNELTKRLLAEGYSAENHPDYVEVGRCCRDKDNAIMNLDGGFLYYRWYVYEKAFRTPCGLMCKGLSCDTSLRYNGVEWSFENDLATIHCPYGKADCDKKDSRLPQSGVLKNWCNVHLTNEEYRYDGSIEDILKQDEDRIRREKISFSLQRHGRTCDMQMHYDTEKREWKMNYDPKVCARFRCRGHYGKGGEVTEGCPILGRPLDKKKGNVYYDLKTSYRRKDLDGTLFDGQIDTQIRKGIRVFDHPVSMDICRNYAKLCKDEIIFKVKMEYHHLLFFAERYERNEFSVEVMNIRAEQKESRDLMQDLQDIRDGITVVHDSDVKKRDKERKREKRQKSFEERVKKMEKKILEVGYENLEPFEQNRACKTLSLERIDELEMQRRQTIEEKKNEPVQMNIMDFLGE